MMMNVQCLIVDGGAVDDWWCKMIDNAGDTDYLIVMTRLMGENRGGWRKSMVHDLGRRALKCQLAVSPRGVA